MKFHILIITALLGTVPVLSMEPSNRPTEDVTLHFYELQHHQAERVAGLLNDIINFYQNIKPDKRIETAEDIEQVVEQEQEEKIIIVADHTKKVSKDGQLSARNRLIIVARDEDWIQIRQLIEEIDIPRPEASIVSIHICSYNDQSKVLDKKSHLKKIAVFTVSGILIAGLGYYYTQLSSH